MDKILRLTAKEEEVMNFFWSNGAKFVKELLEYYDDPKPHFNTISTIVRGLEEKGFLLHKVYGNTHQYFDVISEDDFRNISLKNVINKYYSNSAMSAISSLVDDEVISLNELKDLIKLIEKGE